MFVNSFKRAAKIFIDAALCALSIIIAYKLRLDYQINPEVQNWYWEKQIPFLICSVVFIKISLIFIFQIYRKMWRYTEITEILELLKPILVASIIISIPRILGFKSNETLFAIPIGVIIIDAGVSLILLSGARLIRRIQIKNRLFERRKHIITNKPKKRTLIIGAGVAANELVRKIEQHPELDVELISALDDDTRKKGTIIGNSVKVKGQIKDLPEIAREDNIEEVIISIPSLDNNKIKEIIDLCTSSKLETKIIPGVDQLAGGQITIEQIRKISLEDLLGRETVDLSIPEISNFIDNKIILITGAGGSIGSEITKQLLKHTNPKKVYILGRGENSIFLLQQELKRYRNETTIPIICDVRNYKNLYKHIDKIKPDVIFHAAAHKHVPLMEDHPQEAFENNTLGTKNIADIAGIFQIKTLVNISTDKAVNPVNVLGFTKRLAELYIINCAKKYPNTKYISVRFGNVIGSRGSVIPTWEYQLKNNLPITVTSKETYRYFMTIPEAAQLVIKSGAIGKSSEIMVLDMGDEVNIYKLANDFINLSGFDTDKINIEITGLRPGEKLREELVNYYEGTNTTKYKKILVINSSIADNTIDPIIDELIASEDLSENEFKNLLNKKVFEISLEKASKS